MRRAAVLGALLSTVTISPAISASAPPPDQALVARYRPPSGTLDPVLQALADGRLERHPIPPLAGADPPPVSLGYALTGSELGPFDVTHTEAGRGQIAAFVGRLRRRGIEPDPSGYRVFALPSIREVAEAAPPGEADPDAGPMDSALVVPEGTEVGLVGAIFEGGRLHSKTTITATALVPEGAGGGGKSPRILGGPAKGEGWEFAGGKCLSNGNRTAWYDPCQWFYWHPDDHDPAHHYWAAEYYGTAKSKGAFVLDAVEAAGWRSPGTEVQEWVDWNPRADSQLDRCERQSVGVSFAGLEVARESDHCELWDIHKGREAADFANWWRGAAARSERDTSAATATRTSERESPTDDFDFDYYAHVR